MKRFLNNDGTFKGALLREKRKALGLTQKELSWRVGISFGYLSQIEICDRQPGIDAIRSIAAYFKEIESYGKEVKIRVKPVREEKKIDVIRTPIKIEFEPLYWKE